MTQPSPYAPPEVETSPPVPWSAWLLTVLATAVFAGIGGLVGFVLMRAAGPDAQLFGLGVTIVGILAAIWLQLFLHELGHAAAGLMIGMRLYGVGFGSVRVDRAGQGWRWCYAPLKGIGGYALALPVPSRAYGRREHFAFLLGGPAANLVSASLALCIASQVDAPLIHGLLVAFALVGLAQGLLNLLPLEIGGFMTDGWGLREVLRDSPRLQSLLDGVRLAGYGGEGLRPRDWPGPPALASTEDCSPIATSNTALRLLWALDTGNADEARRAALDLRQRYLGLAPLSRGGIAAVMASFAAIVEHDALLLDAWLSRVGHALVDLSLQRAWLTAELAALRGAADLASRIDQARAALDRAQDAGTRAQIAERLNALAAGPDGTVR